MAKKTKRLLGLLLILVVSCTLLSVTAWAAEAEGTTAGLTRATLATPSGVTMENTETGIQLTWNKVSGAAAYRVFIKSASGWKRLGDTTQTGFTYSDVTGGTAYTFTVRCISADGKSYTSSYNAAGWTWTYVEQPAIKTLENRTTGVKLTWDSVAGAERYRIYVKEADGEWDYVGNTMGNTFTYIWAESGKDYSFTLRCANKDNNVMTSSFDATGWQIRYIGQPKVSTMENVAEGVKLTWNSVSGAERYRVYVKLNGKWKCLGSTTGTAFTATGLTGGETYAFTIRCANRANTALTSSYFESGWNHTYIAAPVISKLETLEDSVQISWDAVTGAQRYRVYVKKDGKWKLIGSTTKTTMNYANVISGQTYAFTVRCVDSANKTFTSGYNTTGWSVQYMCKPVISNLENTMEGIKLSWDAVPGMERYRVYVKVGSKWKCVGKTTETSFVYDGAVSGEEYTFTLRCTDGADKTYTSAYNTTGWTLRYVAAPEMTGLESTNDGVKLTWNSVAGAERYRVYVKLNGKWKCIGKTTETSFVYDAVNSGEEYTFTLRCVDGADKTYTSVYNTTGWSLRYIAAPKVTALEQTKNGVKLTWDSVAGAERYRVYVKMNGKWKCLGNTTDSTFTATGLTAGQTYTFTVRCVDSANKNFTSVYDRNGWSITLK